MSALAVEKKNANARRQILVSLAIATILHPFFLLVAREENDKIIMIGLNFVASLESLSSKTRKSVTKRSSSKGQNTKETPLNETVKPCPKRLGIIYIVFGK